MKAAQLTKFNSPLKITPVTLPHLSPKEVAVQVHFAGINFYELKLNRSGIACLAGRQGIALTIRDYYSRGGVLMDLLPILGQGPGLEYVDIAF